MARSGFFSATFILACSSAPDASDAGLDASASDVQAQADTGGADGAGGDAADASGQGAGFYGTPWNADGLSNDQIGYKPTRQADIRFRSQGGAFAGAKIFFIVATYMTRTYCNQPPFTPAHPNNCYAAGTGGIIRIDLVPDDGTASHNPTTNVLSTVTLNDPMNINPAPPIYGVKDANFRLVSNFSATPMLAAGALYHLVFTNLDADPTQNYISIDCLYHSIGNANRQPGVSDVDLATLLSDDGVTWIVRKETPIFEVLYGDTHIEGQGYMGTRVTVPEPLGAAARARSTFVVGKDKTVDSISVRLQAQTTSSPLTLRLEQADGTEIESGVLQPAAFDTVNAVWAKYTFAQPHVLTKGQGYHVLLTAPVASSYSIYPLEKGIAYGFDPALVFGDGHAEYDDGSGFVAHYAPWGDMSEFDFQLYFTTL